MHQDLYLKIVEVGIIMVNVCGDLNVIMLAQFTMTMIIGILLGTLIGGIGDGEVQEENIEEEDILEEDIQEDKEV